LKSGCQCSASIPSTSAMRQVVTSRRQKIHCKKEPTASIARPGEVWPRAPPMNLTNNNI